MSTRTGTPRRYGPDVGEPPPLVDPRRWGSVVGLLGGLLFVLAYAPALHPTLTAAARLVAVLLFVAALLCHYGRPVALGPLERPRPRALAVYLGCVAGELVVIAVGTGVLTSAGRGELRPALIAAVVGLHLVPMGWAFGERMFGWLGGLVAVVGVAGLLAGLGGVADAAEAAAVLAGLAMLAVITLYARGRFAEAGPSAEVSRRSGPAPAARGPRAPRRAARPGRPRRR